MAFDVIVLGLGAMGSATAWRLACRGRRVLGLDAFTPGHARGSSHGYTRIIRKAYFEDPAYVPLLEHAYALWDELAHTTPETLWRMIGGLMLGRPASEVVGGALRSARAHGLPHEVLTAAEVHRRFPAFTPAEEMVAVWEPQAGILFPERCIRALLRAAERAGAELRYDEPAGGWRQEGDRIVVETSSGRYEAGHLVITAGPWAAGVLAEPALPLTPTRQVVCWFAPARDATLLAPDRCPLFICAFDRNNIYGVPAFDERGVKAAIHEPGEACTPETIRRHVDPEEIEALRRLLGRILPAADGPLREAGTCLYTMTPDGHFVIGRSSRSPRAVYAAGFSGHGFKFAPIIGEVLADLAIDGRTAQPIAFLAPERFTAASGQARV